MQISPMGRMTASRLLNLQQQSMVQMGVIADGGWVYYGSVEFYQPDFCRLAKDIHHEDCRTRAYPSHLQSL